MFQVSNQLFRQLRGADTVTELDILLKPELGKNVQHLTRFAATAIRRAILKLFVKPKTSQEANLQTRLKQVLLNSRSRNLLMITSSQ